MSTQALISGQREKLSKRKAPKGSAKVAEGAKQLKALAVEYVDVGTIHENTYNANRQSDEEFKLLCRSITDDGFTQPVIVLREGRTIVDGEHRWRAARKLGIERIPVVFVDMSPEQMRIATLRHNRARGSEDVAAATDVLRDLQALGAAGWAQSALGISDADFNLALSDKGAPEMLAGADYNAGWVPEETDTDMVRDDINTSHTPQAATTHAAQVSGLQAATSEEERTQARSENPVVSVAMFFRGADADLVRRVLGDSPAGRLLELCAAQGEAS